VLIGSRTRAEPTEKHIDAFDQLGGRVWRTPFGRWPKQNVQPRGDLVAVGIAELRETLCELLVPQVAAHGRPFLKCTRQLPRERPGLPCERLGHRPRHRPVGHHEKLERLMGISRRPAEPEGQWQDLEKHVVTRARRNTGGGQAVAVQRGVENRICADDDRLVVTVRGKPRRHFFGGLHGAIGPEKLK
jgi:hypothetical protein